MKIIKLNVLFLLVMVGCTQGHLNRIQQKVVAEVMLLVDSGYIQNQYVVLYELFSNDSNSVYQIYDSDIPFSDCPYELPFKIISYKDKYLCLVGQYEPEMSVTKMKEITHYSGNPILNETNPICKWLLAISTGGQKKILIDFDFEKSSFFDYTELWPYFSGYVKGFPVQMGVVFHNIEIYSDSYSTFNVDSVRQQLFDNIKCVYGRIYMKNNTDSTVCLSSNSPQHYAVVNNQDSLYLSLCDSLPIILGPHERREVQYRSIPFQKKFFENLAVEDDPWESFFNLFCKSTYCLMKINQENLKMRVMSLDVADELETTTEKGESLFRLFRRGVYDRDERDKRNSKYWWMYRENL